MRRRCHEKVSSPPQPQMWIFFMVILWGSTWTAEAVAWDPTGAVCPFPVHEDMGRLSEPYQKVQLQLHFRFPLHGIHGNEDDFPFFFWGRHCIHCNTVSSTKILQNSSTGWLVFIQKACSTVGWREQAPFNPPMQYGISQQSWGSCFPAGFRRRGGQPAPHTLPKVPRDAGRWWWRGQGCGARRCRGKVTEWNTPLASWAGLVLGNWC